MLNSLGLKVHHFPCEAMPFQHMIEGLPDDLSPDARPTPMESEVTYCLESCRCPFHISPITLLPLLLQDDSGR